jgi:oligopeptide transport system substrate-binding protein
MLQKRVLALFGAFAILAAACGGATTSPSPGTLAPGTSPTAAATDGGAPSGEQVLRAYISSDDPPTLDPNNAQDTVSITVLNAVQRGLLYYDKDLQVVPSLAEDLPEVTDNGQTLTFKLRDAKYSNGDPIVAGDLVFGWRRMVDPRQANPYAYVMCPVAGADALLGAANGCGDAEVPTDDAAIEGLLDELGVEAPDDKTFIVRLASPATYFQSVTGLWFAVPLQEKWVNTPNFTEAENFVASGPFMMDSWTHNSEIVLKPNPNWYGDPPKLTEVRFQIGGDISAAVAAYERGDLDVVTVSAGSDIRRVGDDPSLADQLHDQASLGITYYGFATCIRPPEACPTNTNTADGKSPASNKNFRIALVQSVDKQTFIDLTFGGVGQVANSIVMPGLPGYDADYNPYPFDPDSAAQHMATALTELGVKDGPDEGTDVTAADLGRISLGYNVDAGHLPRVAFLAEAWRTTLGFTENQFDLVGTDFATFLQERHAGKYDVTRNGWGADFPHAHNQLSDLFRCGGGNNEEQYCNPEFDRLIDQAATEPDQAKATELYIQAQRIMLDDAPVIPLRFGTTRTLVKPYVQGVQITPQDHTNPGDNFLETIFMTGR